MATGTDPVCDMKVRKKKDGHKVKRAGRTYYFCSQECRQKFQDQPDEYA